MMEFIQAIVESYDGGSHTANVRPLCSPASLLTDVPVALDVAAGLMIADARCLVIAWPDAGAIILCTY